MKYRISHTTLYTSSNKVGIGMNQVHLSPRETPHQRCDFHRIYACLFPPSTADETITSEIKFIIFHSRMVIAILRSNRSAGWKCHLVRIRLMMTLPLGNKSSK